MIHLRNFALLALISLGIVIPATATSDAGTVNTVDAGPQDAGAIVIVDASTSPPVATTVIVSTTPNPVTPADALHDPLASPAAAVSDLRAAKSTGWAALLGAIVVMLCRLAGSLARTGVLAALGRGNLAIGIGLVAAMGAGVYNAAAEGGNWFALLFAGALAATAAWQVRPKEPVA